MSDEATHDFASLGAFARAVFAASQGDVDPRLCPLPTPRISLGVVCGRRQWGDAQQLVFEVVYADDSFY